MSPLPGSGQGDDPFQPLEGDTFQFACHPGVSCFNQCCADLNLILTPYDILRLKNRLGLSSDRFLDMHTTTSTEDQDRFPKVMLRMSETPGRPCPFVRPEGCSVYEDRPGACRIYPIGRGSAKGGREFYFVVKEDHCLGFTQERKWIVEEWLADQGVDEYNTINDLWMEIITSRASMGPPEQLMKKMQMFFMVSYNLDRFRDFVFKSRFLELFNLDAELVDQAREDDVTLLKLGFDWLRFSLFGEKTMPLKNGQ